MNQTKAKATSSAAISVLDARIFNQENEKKKATAMQSGTIVRNDMVAFLPEEDSVSQQHARDLAATGAMSSDTLVTLMKCKDGVDATLPTRIPPSDVVSARQFRTLCRYSNEYKAIEDFLRHTVTGHHIWLLDIGAGFGWVCSLPCLQGRIAQYCGVESNLEFVPALGSAATALCPLAATIIPERFTAATVVDGKFDVVLLCHALYDAGRNKAAMVRCAMTHLRPGGRCIIIHRATVDQWIHFVKNFHDVITNECQEPCTIDLSGAPPNDVDDVIGAYFGTDMSCLSDSDAAGLRQRALHGGMIMDATIVMMVLNPQETVLFSGAVAALRDVVATDGTVRTYGCLTSLLATPSEDNMGERFIQY